MAQKHIIIFSHGFGTKKDDRGLLTDVASCFPHATCVLFDYNIWNEGLRTLHQNTLSGQTKMLKDVIEKCQIQNPDAKIDIIAHSQGAIVVGLATPINIHKIVFIAPSLESDIDKRIKMYLESPGTTIDQNGISKLIRRDGTTTLVPAQFWTERTNAEPITLYNHLSIHTKLLIINAKQDDVLGAADTSLLDKRIQILDLDGDHQFDGAARENLKAEIVRFLK